MTGYGILVLVLAVVIAAPLLGAWRVMVVSGRIRRGETL
jgi:hypothetical protein